ncbi:hypothetical protein [Puia sp.]|jgi:hypothetical protein|uniref:hypothetical protein n=1 Tax=Puia sp. TaxID=2045100 RepID=UPI002F41694F
MSKNLEQLFNEKNQMILKGQIVEASEKFYAPKTKTIDFTGTTTNSKDEHTTTMKNFVAALAKVNEISLRRSAVGDGVTFAEFVFDFDMKDGSKIYWHEILLSNWENGLIVEEQYFKG